MFKRILSFLLACLLLTAALPALALDAETLHGYEKGGYQYVAFGQYPTEEDGTKAPILWRVLEIDGGTAYLLSEYILFASPVHADYMNYKGWLESDLYAYLNSEFLNEAFTAEEQTALVPCWEDNGLVTLLSGDELRSEAFGFVNNDSRLCESTAWAKRERPDNKKAQLMIYSKGHKYSPWWSRTISTDNVLQQRRVMDEGKTGRLSVGNPDMGVRPAIYLDLSRVEALGGSGDKKDPIVLAVAQAASAPEETPAPEAAEATEAPEITTPENEDETELLTEPEIAMPTGEPDEPQIVELVSDINEIDPGEDLVVYEDPEIIELFGDDLSMTDDIVVYEDPEIIELFGDDLSMTDDIAVYEDPETVELFGAPEDDSIITPAVTMAFAAAANPDYIHPQFPALTKEGFLPEGESEFVLQDADNGVWLYASQTLRIQIERRTGVNGQKQPLRWYEARVFTRDASERFHLYPWDEEKYTNPYTLESADKIAQKHHLVFSMNSDYFIYRVGRDREEKQANPNNLIPIGIEIRNGELLYSSPKKCTSEVYPPLDYMVFYEDGSVKTFVNEIDGDARARSEKGQELAAQWIADGATDCLSFGPILVENGAASPRASMYGSTPNPRTAFGYVEPGHYVCVMVESRIAESKGESCIWLGEKMAELGCTEAMNLDGGATSTMIFMGKQINKSGNYGDITNRKQNELLGIGVSDAVGD